MSAPEASRSARMAHVISTLEIIGEKLFADGPRNREACGAIGLCVDALERIRDEMPDEDDEDDGEEARQ